ncbi:hypothetical protein [Streptomyces sp. 184]|uniref:hypothetical protein n=1 Tax=Streptomyces sp. 184 TaxID=1827526 RepID=UPI00389262D5
MRIRHMTARAAAVALLATGGMAAATATAAAGDTDGAPGGAGTAPLLDWEGTDRIAPAEHEWGVAPLGDDHGSPTIGLMRANQGIWG